MIQDGLAQAGCGSNRQVLGHLPAFCAKPCLTCHRELQAAGIEGGGEHQGLLHALRERNLHHEVFAVW